MDTRFRIMVVLVVSLLLVSPTSTVNAAVTTRDTYLDLYADSTIVVGYVPDLVIKLESVKTSLFRGEFLAYSQEFRGDIHLKGWLGNKKRLTFKKVPMNRQPMLLTVSFTDIGSGKTISSSVSYKFYCQGINMNCATNMGQVHISITGKKITFK